MGLCIKVRRLLREINESEINDVDCLYIHQEYQNKNFFPLIHNSLYPDGCYEIEFFEEVSIMMAYSQYKRFRNSICEMAIGASDEEVWSHIEQYRNSPFIYLINFTDCDGCYDYTVAEKLLADFKTFKDRAEQLVVGEQCDFDFYDKYKTYITLLETCIKHKAMVIYS